MKIRKGFVSNSSSSSFVCEICDKTHTINCYESDILKRKFASGRCSHVLCKDHLIEIPDNDLKETLLAIYTIGQMHDRINNAKTIKELRVLATESGTTFVESQCPICTLKSISNTTAKDYIIAKMKTENYFTEEMLKEAKNEIREKFVSLEDVDVFIVECEE